MFQKRRVLRVNHVDREIKILDITIQVYRWYEHEAPKITKGQISYVPLDPVADYLNILDLNTRLRVV